MDDPPHHPLPITSVTSSTYQGSAGIPAANRRCSRRFLEHVEENRLTEVAGEPTRGGVPGNLLLANRGALGGEEVARGHLGYSDHDTIQFQFSVKGGKKEEGGQQNHYLGYVENRLCSVQTTG